jgi:hypothetical protein
MQSYLGNQHNIDSLNFNTYPRVDYIITFEDDTIFSFDNLKVNSSTCIAVLTDSSNNLVKMFQQRGNYIDELEDDTYSRNLFKMIQLCTKEYKQPFFVSFYNEYYRDIAFIKEDNLCFYDEQFQYFCGFKDFVIDKYGCMEKYWEILSNEKKEFDEISSMKISTAKELVRMDYKKWYIYFPNDTAKIVDLFMNEMKSMVKLKDNQEKLIRKNIYSCFEKKYDIPFNFVYVIGKDVSYSLITILTVEQYFMYLQKYLTKNRGIPFRCLENYYINEKKLTLDEYIKILKEEILLQK